MYSFKCDRSVYKSILGKLWIIPLPAVIRVVPPSALLADTNCSSFFCTHPDAADGTTPVPAVTPKLRVTIRNVHCGILVLSVKVITVSATCSLCYCILVTVSNPNPTAHKNHNNAFVTICVATNALDFTELQYFPTCTI